MANANTARGLVPYKYVSGAPYSGSANVYSVPASYATSVFLGDPVVPTGASDANGIPVVSVATAGASNNVIGSMVGIVNAGTPQVTVTRDLPVYRAASVNQYILVADDPNLLFSIQENGAMTATTVGNKNANLVSGVGSTVTGWSGWMLNSSTIATTATLQLRVIRFLDQADNAVGTNAKWLVRINLHSITSATGV